MLSSHVLSASVDAIMRSCAASTFLGDVFVSCSVLPGVRQLPTGISAGLAIRMANLSRYTAVTSHNFSVLVTVVFLPPFNCESTWSNKFCFVTQSAKTTNQ